MRTRIVPGVTYDAHAVSRILGLPCECNDPVPRAGAGELVIFYGGWDLPMLRDGAAGKDRMWQDEDWYNAKEWKAEMGYYRVLLRVPDSNRREWNDQDRHLKTIDQAWQSAPICVAATALLVHLKDTGRNLLPGGWCHCAESVLSGNYAILTVYRHRVCVGHISDFVGCDIWLAAVQKT